MCKLEKQIKKILIVGMSAAVLCGCASSKTKDSISDDVSSDIASTKDSTVEDTSISNENDISNLSDSSDAKKLANTEDSSSSNGESIVPLDESTTEVSETKENSKAMSAFESFVNGQTTAEVSSFYYDNVMYVTGEYGAIFDVGEEFTYSDIKSKVDERDSNLELDCSLSYNFLNNGTIDVLSVTATDCGVDYYDYGASDGSYLNLLLSYNEERDKVELVYAADGWSRNEVSIMANTVIYSGGSNGAGNHEMSYSHINDDGHYEMICNICSLQDSFIAMNYYDLFDNENGFEGANLVLLETADTNYYELTFFDETNIDKDKIAQLENYLQTNGYVKTSDINKIENELVQTSLQDDNF